MRKTLEGISITEDQILDQFHRLLTDSDAYELAELVGNIFGGKCCPSGYDKDNPFVGFSYIFYPDENYKGVFGENKEAIGGGDKS